MEATVIVSVKKKKEKKNTLEMQSSQMLNTIGVFSVFYETLYSWIVKIGNFNSAC